MEDELTQAIVAAINGAVRGETSVQSCALRVARAIRMEVVRKVILEDKPPVCQPEDAATVHLRQTLRNALYWVRDAKPDNAAIENKLIELMPLMDLHLGRMSPPVCQTESPYDYKHRLETENGELRKQVRELEELLDFIRAKLPPRLGP